MEMYSGIIVVNTKTMNWKKIQNEAARIATGATKLVCLNALYIEIQWENLSLQQLYFIKWNLISVLTISLPLFYKLSNTDRATILETQTILIQLMPEQPFITILFFSSSIRAWNDLSEAAAQTESVNAFKTFLNKDRIPVPKHYYRGKRKLQILHTRLRTNCSSLNLHLFTKNISDSPLCSCGSTEDNQHYFFYCMHYQRQRNELLNAVARYTTPTLNLLLYGDSSLLWNKHCHIWKCSQIYYRHKTVLINMLMTSTTFVTVHGIQGCLTDCLRPSIHQPDFIFIFMFCIVHFFSCFVFYIFQIAS